MMVGQMDFFVATAEDAVHIIPKDVLRLFERTSLQVNKAGYARYSSDAILHRIRWHMQIERGQRDFKCNNNWTAPLARWFLERHPELEGFFELRESPHQGEKAND